MKRVLSFFAMPLIGLFGCSSCGNIVSPSSQDSGLPTVVAAAMHWPGEMVPVGYGINLRRLVRENPPPFAPDLMAELSEVLALHHERQSKSQYPFAEVDMRSGLMFPWDGTGDIDLRSRTVGTAAIRETNDGQMVEFNDYVRGIANGETSVVTRHWKFTLKRSGRRLLVDDAEFEAISTHEERSDPALRTRWSLSRKLAELKMGLQPRSS